MKSTYRAVLVWALRQLLGAKRGSAVYAKLVPIIVLAESGAFDGPDTGK